MSPNILRAHGDAVGPQLTPLDPARQRRALRPRIVSAIRKYERIWMLAAGVMITAAGLLVYDLIKTEPREITQADIDAAVEYSLGRREAEPAQTAMAYSVIAPSVVRVATYQGDDTEPSGLGTGVVVDESGLILTNHHVIDSGGLLTVTFADGYETPAAVVSVQPHNDLAVLRAEVIPEGLRPATMSGTSGLRPGDTVVAVGHPFGIGPSVTAGVVSGLNRNFVAGDGETMLGGLIQFDAAVNPGNSGGPLVDRNGEVLGIVTSILNPTDEKVFIGIGFAVTIETAAAALGPSPF